MLRYCLTFQGQTATSMLPPTLWGTPGAETGLSPSKFYSAPAASLSRTAREGKSSCVQCIEIWHGVSVMHDGIAH